MALCSSVLVRKSIRACSWATLRPWDSIRSVDLGDPPARSNVPSLAPRSQRACYLPWLKISVVLRYVLTYPWPPRRSARSGSTSRGSWPSRTAFEGPAGSTDGGNSTERQSHGCSVVRVAGPSRRRLWTRSSHHWTPFLLVHDSFWPGNLDDSGLRQRDRPLQREISARHDHERSCRRRILAV